MTPAEAGVLLAGIAVIDNRKPGSPEEAKTAAKMWAGVLHDITLAEATRAATEHFGESTEWLMPAHVRRRALANRTRNARALEGQTPTQALAGINPPPHIDPDDTRAYQTWLAGERSKLARGQQPTSHTHPNPVPAPAWFRAIESRRPE